MPRGIRNFAIFAIALLSSWIIGINVAPTWTVERIEFPVLGRLGRSRSPDIQVGERMPDERTDWHFPTEWARAAP